LRPLPSGRDGSTRLAWQRRRSHPCGGQPWDVWTPACVWPLTMICGPGFRVSTRLPLRPNAWQRRECIAAPSRSGSTWKPLRQARTTIPGISGSIGASGFRESASGPFGGRVGPQEPVLDWSRPSYALITSPAGPSSTTSPWSSQIARLHSCWTMPET
jgi:hypothetical protein